MNLKTMLAAFAVATASLMAAPMAAASPVDCPTADEGLSISPISIARATDGSQESDTRIFSLALAAPGVVVVEEASLADDVKVTILKVTDTTTNPDKCDIATDISGMVASYQDVVLKDLLEDTQGEGSAADQPGFATFNLAPGDYFIKVIEESPASGGSENFNIRAV